LADQSLSELNARDPAITVLSPVRCGTKDPHKPLDQGNCAAGGMAANPLPQYARMVDQLARRAIGSKSKFADTPVMVCDLLGRMDANVNFSKD
jgi:hypothetical protein